VTLSLDDLRARRGALVERARAERAELGRIVDGQRPWLSLVDTGVSAVRFCLANKRFILVAAVAFAIVQPRRALRWVFRALSLFQLVRKIRRTFPV
jgi:hypothetical protein